MPSREQWTPAEANAWYAAQPWLVGCNYIPSNAVNQLEMWQAETFDVATNERELGWAAGLGMNTAWVFLHDLLWQQDADGFVGRMERFIEVASGHGIRPLFVLFDGVWFPQPQLGPQPASRPRVHNSRWVQSPGAAVLSDPARQDDLEGYVSGVVGRFRDDERVLGWDLFNEPDNPNMGFGGREIEDKAERAMELLRKAYGWARGAGPSQPMTAGVWRGDWRDLDAASEIDGLMLTESDVISFHSYDPPDKVRKRIDGLEQYRRPLLLTEFLARGFGSTLEGVLPLLKDRRVGACCWGLVSGKTQTIYPWDSWQTSYESEPERWFHDVLRADGTPYDEAEAALLRRMTAR